MAETTRQMSSDLQASAPEVPIGLSRAGVTGVQKAVRIGRGAQEKLIAATIDCTVDLDPSQKGVHMSRFPELFEEAIEGVVADDAFLIEDLAEHVATRIVERQHAVRRRGTDPCALSVRAHDAGDRALDAGDGDADRHRSRVAHGRPPHRRRRGDRHQRVPVRTGARPRQGVGTPPRGGLRRGRRRAHPRARPDRDPQPARSGHAPRRHVAPRQRGAAGRARRGVDELADLRVAEAARRALRRRARASAAALRRGLGARRAEEPARRANRPRRR